MDITKDIKGLDKESEFILSTMTLAETLDPFFQVLGQKSLDSNLS